MELPTKNPLALADPIPSPLSTGSPAPAAPPIPPPPPAPPRSSTRTNSRVYTIFLLLNSMIGSGVFNMPHVFSRVGLVSAYCMLTVAALFIYAGLVFLVAVSAAGGGGDCSDYSSLAVRVMGGAWAGHVVDASIVVIGLGSLLSYLAAITGTVTLLLSSWGSSAAPLAVTSALVACVVFPLCLQRFYGHFSGISVVSMLSVSGVLVLVGGPLYAQQYEGASPRSEEQQSPTLVVGDPLSQLGSVVFTLSCASAAFHTFRYMRERSLAEWRSVAAWTVGAGWTLCALMGTGGALTFRNHTNGIILNNFRRGHVADFFQLLFVLHLVLYIPLDFLVARHSLLRLAGVPGGAFASQWQHVLLCAVLLAAPTALIFWGAARGMDSGAAFSVVLNISGGLGGSVVSFVLPAALYLKQRPEIGGRPALAFAVLMLLAGLVVSVYVPVITVSTAL